MTSGLRCISVSESITPQPLTPQLLALKTLNLAIPWPLNPFIRHPISPPLTLFTQYMYPNPLTLSLSPDPLDAKPLRTSNLLNPEP